MTTSRLTPYHISNNNENQPLLRSSLRSSEDRKRIEQNQDNDDDLEEGGGGGGEVVTHHHSYQTDLAPPSTPGNYRHVHFQPTLSKIGSSGSFASVKNSITSRLSAVSQRRDSGGAGGDYYLNNNDELLTNNNNINRCCWCLPSCCRSIWNSCCDDSVYFGARVSVLTLVASLFATNQLPLGKDIYGHDIVWPQGSWVAISTLMVCWFPKLDAASVIQKSLQRIFGTLLGGFMALTFGILSRRIITPDSVERRAWFLHASYAFGCFLVPCLSMKVRLNRTTTLMGKYNYGTVLCLLTFTIALFPFLEQDDPWKKATYRIMNVFLGCVIAAIGSMLVLPRSTNDMLLQRIQKQCQWAGESSEAVLHASADVLGESDVGTVPQGIGQDLLQVASELAAAEPELFQQPQQQQSSPPQRRGSESESSGYHHIENHRIDGNGTTSSIRMSLGKIWGSIRVSALRKSFFRVHEEILQEHSMNTALDVVIEKYESALRDWKDTKGLFKLSHYDPFHYIVPASKEFRDGCDTILSKALRIQTTVVLLDGMVRNDPQHLLFLDETLFALLTEIGTLIRKMLAVPRQPAAPKHHHHGRHAFSSSPPPPTEVNDEESNNSVKANDVAKSRLLDRLYCFRNLVNQMATNMIQTESLMDSIACGCHLGGNQQAQQPPSPRQDSRCRHRSTVVNPGSKHYALLFLQLVEHLTHRSISLYDSWVKMEESFEARKK